MQYKFNVWNKPLEPISNHPRKGGGLWVTPTLSIAKSYVKYLNKKHGITARVFKCKIDDIMFQSSCRIKTNKLRFTEKDEIIL